jgi:hypothetical protein
MLVPQEVHERFWEPDRPKNDHTEVDYTYANCRRFQVSVDEEIK